MADTVLANRYELIERIGDGGMASVYMAHDRFLDRYVAIKVLHPQFANDSRFIARFKKEAQGAAKLSHANIVNIYDVVEWSGQYFIVMEYVEGETLKDKIKREGSLSVKETLSIAEQIASALEHAHQHNLIHCDIKPHNILIKSNGQVKVADFGIARAASSSTMTYSGNIVGSVHYISPEQARGNALSTKSDIYSLGVVIYEMLTGQVPFHGDNAVGIALQHVQKMPIPIHELRQDVPPIVEAIVLKAMNKDETQRMDSRQMLTDIKRAEGMLFGRSDEVNDPYATRILSKQDFPDMTMESAAVSVESQPQAVSKPFMKSKKFIFLLLLILVAGFFTGAFLSFGKFWTSAEIVVPSVVGETQAQATEDLTIKKLRVNVEKQYSDTVPEGNVISQDPQAGTKVKEERLITIVVSQGGKQLTMPDVLGISQNDAQNQLTRMGLTIGQVTQVYSSQQPAGVVLKQMPLPGSSITKGSSVDLIISKGAEKKTNTVPNLLGMDISKAKAILQKNNINLGNVQEVVSEQAPGTVLSQSVTANSAADSNTTVDLVIAESASNNSKTTAKRDNGSSPTSNKKVVEPTKNGQNQDKKN